MPTYADFPALSGNACEAQGSDHGPTQEALPVVGGAGTWTDCPSVGPSNETIRPEETVSSHGQ